jgi:hypothetical protein
VAPTTNQIPLQRQQRAAISSSSVRLKTERRDRLVGRPRLGDEVACRPAAEQQPRRPVVPVFV